MNCRQILPVGRRFRCVSLLPACNAPGYSMSFKTSVFARARVLVCVRLPSDSVVAGGLARRTGRSNRRQCRSGQAGQAASQGRHHRGRKPVDRRRHPAGRRRRRRHRQGLWRNQFHRDGPCRRYPGGPPDPGRRPEDQIVTVYKGVERESYSCMPICQRRVTLGDGDRYFRLTIDQAGSLSSQASGSARRCPQQELTQELMLRCKRAGACLDRGRNAAHSQHG